MKAVLAFIAIFAIVNAQNMPGAPRFEDMFGDQYGIMKFLNQFSFDCQGAALNFVSYAYSELNDISQAKDIQTPQVAVKFIELSTRLVEKCQGDVENIAQNPSKLVADLVKIASAAGIEFDVPKGHVPANVKTAIEDVEDFVEGFFTTFDVEFNLPDYPYCIEAALNATNTMDEVSYYFNQGTIKGYLNGLSLMSQLYDDIGQALYSCGQADQAAQQRVEEFVESLQNPNTLRLLAISFLQELPQLLQAFHPAAQSCQAQDFYNCGADSGNVVNIVARIINY